MVNIKMPTIGRKLFTAYLTSKLVAMFRQSTLPCPRALIINNLAPLPPGTHFAFNVLRAPLAVAFMRAKRAVCITVFKFVRLAKNRVVALYAIDYFPCSCFQSTRFTTTFAWFVAGNTGKYRKSVSAMFACFVDFWFMFHGITVTRVATMSSKMPVLENSRGKK